MLNPQPAKPDGSCLLEASLPAPIPLILVGVPPEFGDSWRAVIRAKPPFQFAGAAATDAQGLELLAALPPCRRVVVVDFSLSTSVATAMLESLRDQWPQAHRLALVGTSVQRLAARAAGAEAVLFRGFAVAELNSVLDQFASGPVIVAAPRIVMATTGHVDVGNFKQSNDAPHE